MIPPSFGRVEHAKQPRKSNPISRLGDFNDGVSHFIFNRLNWSQGILIRLLSRPGMILSNQQIHEISNHSNQKDEGYDGRGVGHSCLLFSVNFEQTMQEIEIRIVSKISMILA